MTTIQPSPPPTSQPPSAPDNSGSNRPRKRVVRLVVACVLAAVVIVVLAESWVTRAEMAAAFLIGVAIYRSRLRALLPILVAISGVLALLYFVGSYNWLLDL